MMFKKELAKIKSERLKEFAEYALKLLPEYFWVIPASSSGKYHPASSLGKGGLVRHTKAALKIAEELFPFVTLGEFNENEKDLIRISLLLHDGLKSGFTQQDHTVHEHPLLVVELLNQHREIWEMLFVQEIQFIMAGIQSHMSSWNTSERSDVILPLPATQAQIFIALCDYLSARKIFNIEVEDET